MDTVSQSRIVSPCVGICELDIETDCCIGCWRTRKEVAAWSLVDDRTRLKIVAQARKRRNAAKVDDGKQSS